MDDLVKAHIKARRFSTSMKVEKQRMLETAFEDTKDFFHANPDLIAVATDKSKKTVVMDMEEYRQKVRKMMSDMGIYREQKFSAKNALMVKNRKFLEQLYDKKVIKYTEMKVAVARERETPRIYGLLKDHKENFPLRPVVNTRGSPGYTIAKTLCTIFADMGDGGRYDILSSTILVDAMRELPWEGDIRMATADIRSMFTNITRDMAMRSIEIRYEKLKTRLDLTLNDMKALFSFACYEAGEIMFEDDIWVQIMGLLMGNPFSTMMAGWTTLDMLEEADAKVTPLFFMLKYIDDFLMVNTVERIEQYVRTISNSRKSIKFDITHEENNMLNFLDITIIRERWGIWHEMVHQTCSHHEVAQQYFSTPEAGLGSDIETGLTQDVQFIKP